MNNIQKYNSLFTPVMILSLLVLFCSCSSTKVSLKKEIYRDTISFHGYRADKFYSAFRTIKLKDLSELAETDAQKLAATGLNYVFQNQYDSAVSTFMTAFKQKDTIEPYWKDFILKYYSFIDYDWKKLKELATVRPDIAIDNWINFYVDKPELEIDFTKDSVVIPIEFDFGRTIPKIVITINGKKFEFMLDTGCDKTLFFQNIITHLSTTNCDTNGISVNAIDGTSVGYNCFLPQLDLGDIKINNFPIFTVNKDEWKVKEFLFITTFQCDGVIGWDLLHHFDFTIDYKNAQLVLRKPIKKEVKNRNLFWYHQPLVLFQTKDNFLIITALDTGADATSFDEVIIEAVLELEKDKLKSKTRDRHGLNGWIETTYYDVPNFNIFTISDTTINNLTASTARFSNFNAFRNGQPMYITGWLGSDWFKDKIVRVDMTNGIFEISE